MVPCHAPGTCKLCSCETRTGSGRSEVKETKSTEKTELQLYLRQCRPEAVGVDVPVTLKLQLWKTVPGSEWIWGLLFGLWGWTEMQVSSGRNDKMLDMACESPAWFPQPRYALEKYLVKLEDQTDVRFTLSGVMSLFLFVSCSIIPSLNLDFIE